MESTSRRVAVIGAGVTGLLATKVCLEEGLQPVCFEQHDQLGGTWYYTEDERPNQTAASYKSLTANTDTASMSFSDFPVPVEEPVLFSLEKYHQYLQSYARHFDLQRYIHFNHTVKRVKPAKGYEQTGQWEVIVRSCDSDVDEHHVFDAVCLCSGALKKSFTPNIPGLSTFEGKVMHSTQYRRPEVFEGQTVLVIGKQYSAGDVACGITNHAKQVYLSVGDGTNVVPIIVGGRYNADYDCRRSWLRSDEVIGRGYRNVAAATLNHSRAGIGDGGNPLNGGYIMLSDDVTPCLMKGKITITPKVDSFTEDSVRYVDGTAQKIDSIVFATGFRQSYDFVECSDLEGDRQIDFNLYKGAFPLSCKHPTLAVMSSPPQLGSYMFHTDVTARWAICVLAKKRELPDQRSMQNWLRQKRAYIRDQCGGRYQVHAYSLAEDVAAEFGVQPRFCTLLFRSPSLAYKVYFGPPHTCHYRLVGHGASEVAWKHSHKFYDHHFPDDIPRKMRRLFCDVVIVSLVAVGAAFVKTNWQMLVNLGN